MSIVQYWFDSGRKNKVLIRSHGNSKKRNRFAAHILVQSRVYKEGGRVLNHVYTPRNIRSEGSRPLK